MNLGNVRTVIAGPYDSAATIAKRITGHAGRAGELIAVNPHKRITPIGTFAYVADGERLVLPMHWPSSQPSAPSSSYAARGRFEAGALPPVALPNGWTDDDLLAVAAMGPDVGVSNPRDLLAVWGSETGIGKSAQLSPKTALYVNGSPIAGGLNGSMWSTVRGMGFRSMQDWLSAPIRVQLQGILQQYLNAVKLLGEGFDARARRLGTTTGALIYAMNFLPGVVAGVRSRTQIITQAGQTWYDSNRILDSNQKGYINLADFEYWTRSARFPTDWPLPILASRVDDLRAQPETVALLSSSRSSVWDAVRGLWSQLTGRSTVENAPAPPSSPRFGAMPSAPMSPIGEESAAGYTAATGLVLAGIFVVAWHEGWLNRLLGR